MTYDLHLQRDYRKSFTPPQLTRKTIHEMNFCFDARVFKDNFNESKGNVINVNKLLKTFEEFEVPLVIWNPLCRQNSENSEKSAYSQQMFFS